MQRPRRRAPARSGDLADNPRRCSGYGLCRPSHSPKTWIRDICGSPPKRCRAARSTMSRGTDEHRRKAEVRHACQQCTTVPGAAPGAAAISRPGASRRIPPGSRGELLECPGAEASGSLPGLTVVLLAAHALQTLVFGHRPPQAVYATPPGASLGMPHQHVQL